MFVGFFFGDTSNIIPVTFFCQLWPRPAICKIVNYIDRSDNISQRILGLQYIKIWTDRRWLVGLIYDRWCDIASTNLVTRTLENIGQCDATLWRLILIKTITSILKVSTYIITSTIARPIKLALILYNYYSSLSAECNMMPCGTLKVEGCGQYCFSVLYNTSYSTKWIAVIVLLHWTYQISLYTWIPAKCLCLCDVIATNVENY